MPPTLDVYAVAVAQSEALLDRFLEQYVDVEASDHERYLLVLRRGFDGSDRGDEQWEDGDVVVPSLDAAIRFGLGGRAFVLYLSPRAPWGRAMVAFTVEGGLVLGVSVDDEGGRGTEQARAGMAALFDLTGRERAWIAVDEPPPVGSALSYVPWVVVDELGGDPS